MRKIKETSMLESKISKEDLIRANVNKDRAIQAIRRYVSSIPEYVDKQVKVYSTNGLGKWEMVVSQRNVDEFTDMLLSAEFLGLIAPEDIVDVREVMADQSTKPLLSVELIARLVSENPIDDREMMKFQDPYPVWGWKVSGLAMDSHSEISLCYMEIPFEFFKFY
ncbi:hypothetical protein [uncultured Porphyromonas sp.]|uniref:hypothetical protein n=1 Tax=uncultured Porphyromonas sp. TaxID=159274 RepID=UPI002633B89F|nr:hypothetical protein [uncultured Porphyromonas sp.]